MREPLYLENMQRLFLLPVVACSDIDLERAEAAAKRISTCRAVPLDVLLADPRVDLVLNLTPPQAHAEVSRLILNHGKHLYTEKPLATNREAGRALLALAGTVGRSIGCAPDTFLGEALQICRALIDGGAIGEPVAAMATMMCHGHESWHPTPDFYYQPGGGPLFDMGPYYLTALIALLGPVRRVSSLQRITFPERTVSAGPRMGATIEVRVPTHVAALLEFVGGSIATLVTSFDVWNTQAPPIEIYGGTGSLTAPDPNGFGGHVSVRYASGSTSLSIDIEPGGRARGDARGLGVADMCAALTTGRHIRANAALAFHVLDVMQAIDESAYDGRHVTLTSSCERPASLEHVSFR